MAFENMELGLSQSILEALEADGASKPSALQIEIWKKGCKGESILVQAKSGKKTTLTFAVVILEKFRPHLLSIASSGKHGEGDRGAVVESSGPEWNQKAILQTLVLTRTREMAISTKDTIQRLGSGRQGFVCSTFVGGIPAYEDIKSLGATGCHVAVGTPGRVRYLMGKGALIARSAQLLVVDSADWLMAPIFQDDVGWISRQLSENKQVLAFSASDISRFQDGLASLTGVPCLCCVEGEEDVKGNEDKSSDALSSAGESEDGSGSSRSDSSKGEMTVAAGLEGDFCRQPRRKVAYNLTTVRDMALQQAARQSVKLVYSMTELRALAPSKVEDPLNITITEGMTSKLVYSLTELRSMTSRKNVQYATPASTTTKPAEEMGKAVYSKAELRALAPSKAMHPPNITAKHGEISDVVYSETKLQSLPSSKNLHLPTSMGCAMETMVEESKTSIHPKVELQDLASGNAVRHQTSTSSRTPLKSEGEVVPSSTEPLTPATGESYTSGREDQSRRMLAKKEIDDESREITRREPSATVLRVACGMSQVWLGAQGRFEAENQLYKRWMKILQRGK